MITATIKTYYPAFVPNTKITLPTIIKEEKELPSAEEVIDWTKGTDIELVTLIAMWLGMRASEIRGLKKSDFKDGYLQINRVIITTKNKNIEKTKTKTKASRRVINVPYQIQRLVDSVPGEYVTSLSGVQIYKKFKTIAVKNGYPEITFHDLRHLNASVMLLLNIPDKYAMERGGWSSNQTMKNIYQQTMKKEKTIYDDLINSYFSKIYDTKYDTNSEK